MRKLLSCLYWSSAKKCMHKFVNSKNFYADDVSGNDKSGNKVKVDDLPLGLQTAHEKGRNIMNVADLTKEEKEHNDCVKSRKRKK